MTAITSSGSAIDVQTLVTQLMSLEKAPYNKLNSKITSTQSKISALGNLKSKLSTLQSAANALSTPEKVSKASFTVESSNSALVGVSVSGTPVAGTSSFSVDGLPTKQVLKSASLSGSSTDMGLTGVVRLELGSWAGAAFTAKASSAAVDIDLSGKSLDALVSEINASTASSSVLASVETDALGSRLVLTSKVAGASEAMKLSAVGVASSDTDNFTFDKVRAGMQEAAAAADYSYTLNGVAGTSKSATVSLSGITYTMKAVTTAPVSVTVSGNTSGLLEKLKSFVDGYNTLRSHINAVAPVGPETTGVLKGELGIVNIVYGLRKTLVSESGPVGLKQLTMLGIKFEKDGALSLDEDVAKSVIQDDYSKVQHLLAGASGTKGVMDLVYDKVADFLSSDGVLGSRTDGLTRLQASQKKKLAAMEARLPKIEATLYNKYSRLDAALSSMQVTMASLKSSLASISNSNSSN